VGKIAEKAVCIFDKEISPKKQSERVCFY